MRKLSNTNAHSSPITEGKVLSQPVYTRRGNLLLEQGTKITPAVMELLDVFQLSDVVLNTGDLAVDTSSKSLTEKDESNQEEKTTAPLLIQEKSTSAPHPTTVLQRDNNCSCHEVIEEFKQLLKCFQDNRPYSFSSLKKKIVKMYNE